jgi:hypothetical protein
MAEDIDAVPKRSGLKGEDAWMTMKRRPYKRVKPARVTIKMIDGDIIEGTVNVGFEQRVSDLFANEGKPFMPVFDANGVRGEVIIVNKAHIVSVKPEEEGAEFVER